VTKSPGAENEEPINAIGLAFCVWNIYFVVLVGTGFCLFSLNAEDELSKPTRLGCVTSFCSIGLGFYVCLCLLPHQQTSTIFA